MPVFFLSFVWFFYRKQYLMGATLIAVPIILGAFFPVESGAYGGIAIFIALTAKSFYLQAAIPKIAKISAAAEDEAARDIALKNAGGVSKLAGSISLIVFILAAAAAIASAILLPASPS